MYEAVLVVLIVLADQISKIAVRANMALGESIDVIDGFFALTYYNNDGAAFSSFKGQRILLIVVSVIAIILTLIFLWMNKKSGGAGRGNLVYASALSLICGGGIGNLIDRVLFGSVTDMLSFSIFPPIFNVADIGVTVGCGLLIIYLLLIEGREPKKAEEAAGGEAAELAENNDDAADE